MWRYLKVDLKFGIGSWSETSCEPQKETSWIWVWDQLWGTNEFREGCQCSVLVGVEEEENFPCEELSFIFDCQLCAIISPRTICSRDQRRNSLCRWRNSQVGYKILYFLYLIYIRQSHSFKWKPCNLIDPVLSRRFG